MTNIGNHEFVLDRPHHEIGHRWVLYCKHCGYVSAYGNDTIELARERREKLPQYCNRIILDVNCQNQPSKFTPI